MRHFLRKAKSNTCCCNAAAVIKSVGAAAAGNETKGVALTAN